MIKKIEHLNFYELLEVSATASPQEIHRAYERTRRIYDPNSIALYSLFTPEETAAIHQRIEEAYRTLLHHTNRKKYDAELRSREQPDIPEKTSSSSQAPADQPAPPLRQDNRFALGGPPQQDPALPESKPSPEEISPVSPFIAEFNGPALKMLRRQRNLTVSNIADITKISTRYLEYIEEESYQKLPARPYLRGFLTLYAKALGCDPDRVVDDYLKRYDAAMAPPP